MSQVFVLDSVTACLILHVVFTFFSFLTRSVVLCVLQFKMFGQNAEQIGNPSTPNSTVDEEEVVLVTLEKLEKEAVEVLHSILY